jgi:hypothetical protein
MSNEAWTMETPLTREQRSALVAYYVVHPDGPKFNDLDERDRHRWIKAFGEAQKVNPHVVRADPPVSLNEASFFYARHSLGRGPIAEFTLIASDFYALTLNELAAKWKCKIIEVPRESLLNKWTWFLLGGDGIFWSSPMD